MILDQITPAAYLILVTEGLLPEGAMYNAATCQVAIWGEVDEELRAAIGKRCAIHELTGE